MCFIFGSIFVCAYICVYMGLCVQYGDGKKRRKPNYSSVDLSEVEWEDKDDTVGVAVHYASSQCLSPSSSGSDMYFVLLAAKCHGEQKNWDLLHGGEEEC